MNGNSMYDPYECWNEFVGHNYAVIINPLAGLVEYTDNTTESFSGDTVCLTFLGCSAFTGSCFTTSFVAGVSGTILKLMGISLMTFFMEIPVNQSLLCYLAYKIENSKSQNVFFTKISPK